MWYLEDNPGSKMKPLGPRPTQVKVGGFVEPRFRFDVRSKCCVHSRV